jgi:hypothetical protein
MNWTFTLIRPIPFYQPPHSFLLLLIVHTCWLKAEKKKCSAVHMTTLLLCMYICITWIPRWHTVVQKEHTLIHTYTFTIHHRLRSNDVNNEHTKKGEDEERTKVKKKKRYVMVVISSHTNQTTALYTRIKNKHLPVRRASSKRKQRGGFSLFFCLNPQIWRQLVIAYHLLAIYPIDHRSPFRHIVSIKPPDLYIVL